MTPRRVVRVALFVAWAVVFGLWAGWDLMLFTAAILALMNLVLWFYSHKASERLRRVMRPAGQIGGTAAFLAFVAALAGWW